MAGIKETLEAIDLVKKVGDAITAAKADGSIDWKDLTKLGPVLAQMRTAVVDGKLIPEELKDLDETEIGELVNKLSEAVQTLVAAVIT